MGRPEALVRVAVELRLFLKPAHRGGSIQVACNGSLGPVPKAEVEPLLQPGTRRTYQEFSRCQTCGQVYWRGAHSQRLQALIASAQQAVHCHRAGNLGDTARAGGADRT